MSQVSPAGEMLQGIRIVTQHATKRPPNVMGQFRLRHTFDSCETREKRRQRPALVRFWGVTVVQTLLAELIELPMGRRLAHQTRKPVYQAMPAAPPEQQG